MLGARKKRSVVGWTSGPRDAEDRIGILRKKKKKGLASIEEVIELRRLSKHRSRPLSKIARRRFRTEADEKYIAEIARTIRGMDVSKMREWENVKNHFNQPRLFAVDCSGDAVEILEKGKFQSGADLLVSSDAEGMMNKRIQASSTIPIRVFGHLGNSGRVVVDRIDMRLADPRRLGNM